MLSTKKTGAQWEHIGVTGGTKEGTSWPGNGPKSHRRRMMRRERKRRRKKKKMMMMMMVMVMN